MSYIKLTAKRQATLPKALCDELKVEPGDSIRVEKRLVDGREVWCLEPVRSAERPAWFGALRKYAAGKSHDLDEIRESVERAHRRDDL
jgi:bifunctional DNA-binding transcriptional regulator/antitoxin component of YhaV-PrlF toxin-antitoxin module